MAQLPLVEPNLYDLSGKDIQVIYSTSGIDGKPHFTYQDPHQTLNFSGEEIRSVETDTISEVHAMSDKALKIVSAQISRPLPVAEAEAARGVQECMQLSIQVDNSTDKPLYVWSSRRAYDYDAATHVLSIYLTEHTPPLPPGIRMISDHPRAPTLVEVNAKSRGTLDVAVPTSIRRRVPGTGLGMSFVEEPITQIDKIKLHIQYTTDPLQHRPKESPTEHRKRLRAHGQVVQATITPTGQKER